MSAVQNGKGGTNGDRQINESSLTAGRDPDTPPGHYLCLEGVQISLDTYMDDFRTHLLSLVKPGWKGAELDSKVFDSGITNALVAVFRKSKGLKDSREDVVLLRVNGVGTERFICRTDELVCMSALHAVGLCPPVFAKLGNGLCYGYFPGNQVGVSQVREEGISRKIGRLMARLHCVEIPQHFEGREPQVWAKISQWSKQLPSQYSDPIKQKKFKEHIGSLSVLREEVSWLKDLISSSCQSPIVFCHNDPLIANFIYNRETDEVRLIDFEYGGPNYLAFDIADHFCEFAGIEEVDFDLYPDESFQKRWLRTYLEERAKLTGQALDSVTNHGVHRLYKEVNKFALSAHLFWTVWALLQALYSTINFDYMEYAGLRYAEYCRRKDEFSH